MSNACFSTIRSLAITPQCARTRTIRVSTRAAFFERLYCVATKLSYESTRTNVYLNQNALRSPFQTACARAFHSSIVCTARRSDSIPPRRNPSAASSKARGPPWGNLSESELTEIFGTRVDGPQGNYLLWVLHNRRIKGSLAEFGVKVDKVAFQPELALKGLAWLRQKYPMDEGAAAERWAEHEAAKLEKTYAARAEKLGLYRTTPNDNVDTTRALSENSIIEEMQQHHRQQKRKEAEERKASGQEQKEQELRVAKQVESDRQREQRALALEKRREVFRKKGMVSQMDEPPQMSKVERLAPAYILAVLMLFAISFLSQTYEPPPAEKRLLPDIPVSVATIGGIVALNLAIYALWHVPACQRFLNMYFIQVPSLPHAPSILLNIFSHQKFGHLLGNMSTVAFYGIALHEYIGRGGFMEIFLCGGITGSVVSLTFFVMTNRLRTSALGASGAIWAVLTAWAYLTLSQPPKPTDSYGFAKDVAGYSLMIILFFMHFVPGILSRVDVLSHFGGAFMGLWIAYDMKAKGASRRPQRIDKQSEEDVK